MSHRARVLLVEWNVDGTVGGSHQLLYDLARGLDGERYAPVVLFYQQNRFSELLRAEGIEVVGFDGVAEKERKVRQTGGRVAKYSDFIGSIARRAALIRRLRLDLVHLINSPWGGADDWLPACLGTRTPCIATAGALLPPRIGRIRRMLLRRYARILAVSRPMAGELGRLGIERNVSVVHPGIDIPNFISRVDRTRDRVRSDLGVPPDRILVTMVGNIRPWKGQHLALEALARLDPDVRQGLYLLLVGRTSEGERNYARRLIEMIESPELRICARFLGGRLDVPNLFAASDLALHASTRPEPFGLVLVEALATGTPVIASDRGGPQDILTPESGWMFNPDDPSELAHLLEHVSRNPRRLSDMATFAAARATEFSAARMTQNYIAVYDEMLGRSSTRIGST